VTARWPGPGRGARCRLITLALTLGALLLVLTTPVTAHAAPPEVTASQNPVVIPYLEWTKEITLTWRLERGSTQAWLTVTESGTPWPVLNQSVSSPSSTGTVPLTVAYGKTYTAQLSVPFGPALGAPLTITTKRPEFADPDLGCALQCITSVDVQPHGGWAQFTIKTNETAVITVEASTTPPNPNGTWSNPDAVAAFAGTVLPTDNYTPPLANLQANTTYHYVVRAHEHGRESHKTGSFKTLTRRVEVTFDAIQMIDDSDGPFDGDCDCYFLFGAADKPLAGWGSHQNQESVASDTTVHPNVNFTIANAPSETPISAQGYDDDNDIGEFCAVGIATVDYPFPLDWQSSADVNNCLEYAGNQIVVSLSRQGPAWTPGDVDEQFTQSFTMPVVGELVFNVQGTYKVTYVP
jgi:hypothetical protein